MAPSPYSTTSVTPEDLHGGFAAGARLEDERPAYCADEPWPYWVRVAVIAAAAGGLWAAIISGAMLLF